MNRLLLPKLQKASILWSKSLQRLEGRIKARSQECASQAELSVCVLNDSGQNCLPTQRATQRHLPLAKNMLLYSSSAADVKI